MLCRKLMDEKRERERKGCELTGAGNGSFGIEVLLVPFVALEDRHVWGEGPGLALATTLGTCHTQRLRHLTLTMKEGMAS
jgi:hypothetical protein